MVYCKGMVKMKESEILHDKSLEFIKVTLNNKDVLTIVTDEGLVTVWNGTVLVQVENKTKCVKFTDVLEIN